MRTSRPGRRLRWLAVAAALLALPLVGMPIVQAQSSSGQTVTQNEVLTGKLDELGRVVGMTDNQMLRLEGNGSMQVKVPAILSDVTGSSHADVKGTNLLYSADLKPNVPTDIYLSGKAQVLDGSTGTIQTPDGPKQLPVSVQTEYTVDGSKITNLAEAAGRGGEFDIKVTVANQTGRPESVNYTDSTSGKQVTDVGFVFTPLTVNIGPWYFSDPDYKELKVSNGTLTHVGAEGKGQYVVQSSGVLFPPTMPGSYTVEIQGRTKNFAPNSAKISVVPGQGTPLAPTIQDAQQLGGGKTKPLYGALQQFLTGFVQLTDPNKGLPFAAQGADKVIHEGLFVLRDKLAGAGHDVNSKLLPGVQTLYGAITTIRDNVRDQLSPGTASLRDVLGHSGFLNPLCRDLPVNQAGACTYNQEQLIELPPNPALDTTTALAANYDSRGLDPNSASFTKDGKYSYQQITRTVAGQIPNEIKGTARQNGSYLGSLYNWASFISFSAQQDVDANKDGVYDFPPFTFPDPNQHPEYYTAAAMDTVAVHQGDYFPGHTLTGGFAPWSFVVTLCEQVGQIDGRFKPGDPDTDGDGVPDSLVNPGPNGEPPVCPPLPAQDITVRDLLSDHAKDRVADIFIKVAGTGITVDLPVGEALTGGSNKGIYNLLEKPDTLVLPVTGIPGLGPINLQFQRSTCLSSGQGDVKDLIGFNLGELLDVNCALAHSGPLGTLQVSGTVIEQLLHSPGWNFDNWLRGDPGYQLTDLSVQSTGPKLYELVNLLAYQLDRKDALCPSKLVTSPGTGTPRVIPPVLDTPCDKVAPDTSTTDPKTMVGAFTNAILPGIGNPKKPIRDKAGTAANLATALIDIAKGLTVDVPTAVGNDDPAEAGITLAGSLAAIRDGLNTAADQLAPAVSGTPLLISAVGGTQVSGDFQTALSKAGAEQAKQYQSFMGRAKGGSGNATGQVIFVLETVGLKP